MTWKHIHPDCGKTTCYCLGDQSDPMCICGRPAWACSCEYDVDPETGHVLAVYDEHRRLIDVPERSAP